eukprot:NODE_6184_length_289_cov_276.320833_g5572_i0.p1 GENE.NODE_6184_length_289_cov_276.320833_g5572_i0~~NODE_6184_length_289_cov_276.320833_g5572_i0.p1  ORF type:complete len:73 (+),score=11.46 NODE_6184_length_289_cov_276.320833_g5572_i0:34-252(+)
MGRTEENRVQLRAAPRVKGGILLRLSHHGLSDGIEVYFTEFHGNSQDTNMTMAIHCDFNFMGFHKNLQNSSF